MIVDDHRELADARFIFFDFKSQLFEFEYPLGDFLLEDGDSLVALPDDNSSRRGVVFSDLSVLLDFDAQALNFLEVIVSLDYEQSVFPFPVADLAVDNRDVLDVTVDCDV